MDRSALKNNREDFQSMKFPVFGLCRFAQRIVISGGAGAKNVGIKDMLVASAEQMVFDEQVPLSKPTFELELDVNMQYLAANEAVPTRLTQTALLAGSCDDVVYLYRLKSDGTPLLQHKIEVDQDKEMSRVVPEPSAENRLQLQRQAPAHWLRRQTHPRVRAGGRPQDGQARVQLLLRGSPGRRSRLRLLQPRRRLDARRD